ncbi:hypothetical protein, partial [Devosia sp. Leaf64]|uniref:hypothetical protein n=1 Tax=Devosia sp. Leaf64 TaxID=1736229 RepID=UPI00071430E2
KHIPLYDNHNKSPGSKEPGLLFVLCMGNGKDLIFTSKRAVAAKTSQCNSNLLSLLPGALKNYVPMKFEILA